MDLLRVTEIHNNYPFNFVSLNCVLHIVNYFVIQDRESVVNFSLIAVHALDKCLIDDGSYSLPFCFQNEIPYNRLKFFQGNVLHLSVLKNVWKLQGIP